MAILVARMVKMKAGNLHGMQRHNQRETEAHSNKDIDIEKSHLNYDLINDEPVKYNEKVYNIINTQRVSEKAIRKDAVLCDEWIITSQNDFFTNMYPEETEDFFKATCNYFKERCGSQNMVYATVHMDETTPHMHLGIVPMIDGKLSSKEVFSRANLLEIQDELPKYLHSYGFDNIYRGEKESKRKHLSVPEYKQVQEKTLNLQKEYAEKVKGYMEISKTYSEINEDILRKIEQYGILKETINTLDKKYDYSDWAKKNILSVAKEKVGFDKKKKYIFSEEDIEQICKKVNDLNYSSRANDDLLKNNEKLIHENTRLYSSIPNLIKQKTSELSEENKKLEKQNKALNRVFNIISDTKDKVIQDCKKIISDTELYLEKYLNMDEIDIQAYKGYLSMDEEIKLPGFYKLDEEEVIDNAVDIYDKVNLNNHKTIKDRNISNNLGNETYSSVEYDDFELDM